MDEQELELNSQEYDSETTPFATNDSLYNKPIKSIPKPKKNIGMDADNEFIANIIEEGKASNVDLSKIDSLTQISQSRETIYELLDTMGKDAQVAAILETYAEDATERNDQGKIVWCTSEDAEISKYITFLLDVINVDKNIFKWTYSLCKYGDLYLRLFHKSDFDDELFGSLPHSKEKQNLNEDVNLKIYSINDNFEHYVEMVANPAEMFELTKFGKTYAYIQAPVSSATIKDSGIINSYLQYNFRKKDVNVYQATNFVHAALEDNISRTPEKVSIFITDADKDKELAYNVRRGQSLLYNSFKPWRELVLLRNSLMLNRLTKSSILRVIGVEVADMPKEKVGPHLMGVKNLIEQKSALSTNNSLEEYTNPGPMENNIYVPTHNGVGAITTQQIGGDVDVKGLGDIDYFNNTFYSGLRVPKQFLGFTDDGAGFNGGASLTIISSRYAKMIKRIQNTMLQMLSDLVNILLLDKGLESYVNKFELHMQIPATQEENDRRDSLTGNISMCRDILDLLGDVEDPAAKLKITKALISQYVSNTEALSILEEEIERMEMSVGDETTTDEVDEEPVDGMMHSGNHSIGPDIDNTPLDMNDESPIDNDTEFSDERETPDMNQGETILPTPGELNPEMDFSDNTQF